jgi:chromosome segregation ATPase
MELTKDFSQARETNEAALQHAVLRAVTSEQQRDNVSAELHQLRVTYENLDARYKETALLLRESDNRNRALKEDMSRATERLSQVDSESRMLRERSLSAEAALNAHMAQKETMADKRRDN